MREFRVILFLRKRRIIFFNFISDLSYGTGTCHYTSCLLSSSGTVTCVEPCTFVAHCKADYRLWPFDSQNCSMTFGPWMNAEKELDYTVQKDYLSAKGSAENTQWRLAKSNSSRRVTKISGKNGSLDTFIPSISYYFFIERHSGMLIKIYTGHIMILITMNILSMLTKPDMKERLILLAANVYLHFQVLHQMSWTVPHNGENTPDASKQSYIVIPLLFF